MGSIVHIPAAVSSKQTLLNQVSLSDKLGIARVAIVDINNTPYTQDNCFNTGKRLLEIVGKVKVVCRISKLFVRTLYTYIGH